MNKSVTSIRIEESELGKKSEYETTYNPEKLFPITRQSKRDEIGVPQILPFYGYDLWNHYEVSWLNAKGKPLVAIVEVIYDCSSPNIVESKSMKLYFNSFNNTKFPSVDIVIETMIRDLRSAVGADVIVNIQLLGEIKHTAIHAGFNSLCLDELDIECNEYIVDAHLLLIENNYVEESVNSNLLKSNCLVTYQPDWGSVEIQYRGKKINHESLLKYIISFRNHNEFHEQCIERIFMDIMRQCKPDELTVNGRYTRRGGLDINPYRSTHKRLPEQKNARLIRQ